MILNEPMYQVWVAKHCVPSNAASTEISIRLVSHISVVGNGYVPPALINTKGLSMLSENFQNKGRKSLTTNMVLGFLEDMFPKKDDDVKTQSQ